MEDKKEIRDKKVNAIIVKDLSRFGRNHIEVDNYIENIFPMLNVRFISIVDGFDSLKNLDGVDDLKVSEEINNRRSIKIDKLNRKNIYDLINMIYLNKDGLIDIKYN